MKTLDEMSTEELINYAMWEIAQSFAKGNTNATVGGLLIKAISIGYKNAERHYKVGPYKEKEKKK